MRFDDDLDKMCALESFVYRDCEGVSSEVDIDEYKQQLELRLIMEVIAKVIKMDKSLFLPCSRAVKKARRVTALECAVLDILRIDFVALKQTYPNHQFNPVVDAFLKLEGRLINELEGCDHRTLTDDDRIMLHQFVESLMMEVKGAGVRTKLNAFTRVANKNYQGLKAYADSLFDRYSRLLVVRLDVGYRNAFCNPAPYLGVTYEDVKKHRISLLHHLKSKVHPKVVGYVWKLEYGLLKTYHYHLILFFDGAKSQQDINIAKAIGEHWTHEITQGKGIYHNCNARKSEYKRNGILGIGMIGYGDLSLRKGLRTVTAYLTKVDYIVRMLAPEGGRCFGKGGKPSADKKLRRPRKYA